MTDPPFDPYALLEALDGERFGYVIVGGFARVVHGSAETTQGLDIVPSMREDSLRRLGRVLDDLHAREKGRRMELEQLAGAERVTMKTRSGELSVVPAPWGTRGYDDLRIRANRENLGRGLRPAIASVVDLVRMVEASPGPKTSNASIACSE